MNNEDTNRLKELRGVDSLLSLDAQSCEKAEASETGVILNCEKHGDYTEKFYMIGRHKVVLGHCMKCQKEDNESNAKELKDLELKLQAEKDDEAKRLAGVTIRNANVRFKDFVTETEGQKKAHEAVRDFAKGIYNDEQVPNVILTGSVGTGKTMLACCAVNSLFKAKSVKLIKLQDMLRKVKGSYARDSNYTEADAIDAYSSFDLLILDEVGVSRDTDNDKNIIFDVIDGRYQKMLPTMVISNLDIEGIKQTLGDRVVDRLRDGGGVLLGCDWGSYRK